MATTAGGEAGLIELAAVVRSHGLRGELVLKPFNPDSTLLSEVPRVLLKRRDGVTTAFEAESARQHSDSVLIALRDVRTRDQADALRGCLVCVTRSDLPPLDEGEYYLADLVGLLARAEDGAAVGTIERVIEYPSVSCLVVSGAEGTREVPNLPRYVTQVDVPARFVVVDHLEELELVKPKDV